MKNSPYASVKKNILLSMIVVPLVPFLSALGIGYVYFASSIEKSTETRMKRIVEDHRHMIESFLSERKNDLEFIAASYTMDELQNPDVLNSIFKRLKDKNNAYVDLGFFNDQGIHVSYSGPYELIGKNYTSASWFKEAMDKGYYISDVFLGFRQTPHFIMAVTLQSNGRTWMLRTTIDTDYFSNLVTQIRIGNTGEAYLLNHKGLYQTSKSSPDKLMGKDPGFFRYAVPHQGVKTFLVTEKSGPSFLYATTWLKEGSWALVVRQDKKDAYSLLQKAFTIIIFVMALGGALIIGIAFYVSNSVIKRIHKTEKEKGKLEGQLIRAGRFAELGEMSAGFAHEINNPLQIMKNEQSLITIYMNGLKAKLPEAGTDEEMKKDIHEMEDSIAQIRLQIDRCSKITSEILRFARKEQASVTQVEAKDMMREIIAMVEKKSMVNGIVIERNFPDEPLWITADPAQMQQVFLNLLNNAFDAVYEAHGAKGGWINIGMKKDGAKNILISVSDNGKGIEQENKEKIFSPFFTTKPVGQGTGLGLSVCLGIVENLGGSITVASRANQGTMFTVSLPETA